MNYINVEKNTVLNFKVINKPYVITVYDLINEKYPEYFLNNEVFINKKRRVIKNAKRIMDQW